MRSAFEYRMITATPFEIESGGIGYGPGTLPGYLRGLVPMKSAPSPMSSPTAERGFLASLKSSLANAGLGGKLNADSDSAPSSPDSSSPDPPRYDIGLLSHRLTLAAGTSLQSPLSPAIDASKQSTSSQLRMPTTDLNGMGREESIVPSATVSECGNEKASGTVRTQRGTSSVPFEKGHKCGQADAGISAATPALAATIAEITAPVPSPVQSRTPHLTPDHSQSLPEFEVPTANASEIPITVPEGSGARVAGSVTRAADGALIADPTQLRETRAPQSHVEPLSHPVEKPQSGVSEDFSVDNSAIHAVSQGAESRSVGPPNHGIQINATRLPKGNEAAPAQMSTLTDSSQSLSTTANKRAAPSPDTSNKSRIVQAPKVPASRFESAATSLTAHGTAAATEDANPIVQSQQHLSSTRSPSFAAQEVSTNAESVKPEPAPSVRDNAGAAAGDPFVALDRASIAVAPTWTHAGARQAEAGFQDPALGWVGVRAQVDTAGIHASLIPGSAEAAQTLSGHLMGLNDYLEHREAPVHTVTVAAPEGHSNETGIDQSGAQSGGQHQGREESSGHGVATEFNPSPLRTNGDRASSQSRRETEVSSGGLLPGGAYISVFA